MKNMILVLSLLFLVTSLACGGGLFMLMLANSSSSDQFSNKPLIVPKSGSPPPTSGELIGRWRLDDPDVGRDLALLRDGDKIMLETTFSDGSVTTKVANELVQRETGEGTIYERKGGSPTGERYFIDASGDLQIRDDFGGAMTAKKLP